MRATTSALLVMLAIPISVAAQVRDSRTTSTSEIKRQVLIDEHTAQVVRVTYLPGAIEPPGPHAFDVVIIPLSEGKMRFSVAGKEMAPWHIGSAFFIPRQTEHQFANVGTSPVDFMVVRLP